MGESSPAGCEGVIPTLAVGDVAKAIDWYCEALGFRELWRWGEPPAHAGVVLDQAEVHLSRAEPSPGGSWLYFVVADVDALHARFVERGVDVVRDPKDQEWDMREMGVRDLVGNDLTFASRSVGAGPKLPIRRDDLHVRLETRLLSLVEDVAAMKGMSVGEMLEETLLHTFEPWGGGVASPHTASDLRRIVEMKEEHGIDYDVHASYRFLEEEPPDEA